MHKLTVLTPETHGQLKVNPDRAVQFAKGHHMIPLHIGEVTRAIMDFPVMISRLRDQGDYALSALTSFTPGQNAFVANDQWQSSFQPAEMQTFPFALVRGEDGGPVMAMDESLPVFSSDSGDELFDETGEPALWIDQLKNQLLSIAEHTALTRHFLTTLAELDLISPIVITLEQADGEANRIGGLHMINEDRLKSLAPEQLQDLNQRGFLGPIYAILFSVFQLNALILRHNAQNSASIQRINLEIAKDIHQA